MVDITGQENAKAAATPLVGSHVDAIAKRRANLPQRSEQVSGGWAGRDISPRTQREYVLTGEQTSELTQFMVNHLNALNKVQLEIADINRRRSRDYAIGVPGTPAAMANPLTTPEHAHEFELLNKLSSSGKADEQKIREFLATDSGKAASILLMEDVAWRALAANQLTAEMRGAAAGGRYKALRTGIDEGFCQ